MKNKRKHCKRIKSVDSELVNVVFFNEIIAK